MKKFLNRAFLLIFFWPLICPIVLVGAVLGVWIGIIDIGAEELTLDEWWQAFYVDTWPDFVNGQFFL